jgi:hypothetical protein
VTFWLPLLAGIGLGVATVALMAVGGVMNQRCGFQNYRTAISLNPGQPFQ